MEAASRSARNQLFQELKPTCVKLIQLALKDDATAVGSEELRHTITELYNTLERECRGNSAFDDKLADYVFFPVSHVLRLHQKHPIRLTELATKCARFILDFGWRMVAIDLGHQLLILLTLFAGGGPSMKTSEELQIEAFGALAGLFKVLNKTPKGPASLVEISTIPALGQCLTVVLDGITDGFSEECQVTSLLALRSIWMCVKDQQALSTFLPGTISALTKSLMPTFQKPRSRRALVAALEILKIVLTTVVGDVHTRNFREERCLINADRKEATLTKSWLKATGGQVKLALANIIKLRNHKHEDVRMALERMCLDVLDECLTSLPDSASLLVETAMSLASDDRESSGFSSQTNLSDLATVHPSIAEMVKGILFSWVNSLPRVMQSNDESAKQYAMLQISKGQIILSGLDVDSGVLDEAIGNSLRDSVLSILELFSSIEGANRASIDDATDRPLILTSEQALHKEYCPIILPHRSQTQTRHSFATLIASMNTEKQVIMANDMLNYLKHTSGHDLLSAFWISFQLLKAASDKTSGFDEIMSSALTSSDKRAIILAELYSYSVTILVDPEDELDWRIQAVALEIVAYAAQAGGTSFRSDLVDSLYPVVQLLGSQDTRLRNHAIATVNIMSNSCGYGNASNMIVDNIDYLVNAISLKLNTFDISPQAPKVLKMMIRLSGASLLPYLDDIVGSIFVALDNFHGYPQLVDSLFSVLEEIVNESSHLVELQNTAGPDVNHLKIQTIGLSVDNIAVLLESKRKRLQDTCRSSHEDFPRNPWRAAPSLLAESGDAETKEEGYQDNVEGALETSKAPPTKAYKMVQNITRLGQHYLTNQSPLLRRRLLDLVRIACESLYRNEDEFLPLVNDVWPVLIKRLYDEESFVVTGATLAISKIIMRAGDFMATRIQAEWHDLMKLTRQIRAKAEVENKGRNRRGIFSQTWQVWEHFIQLLIAILQYVRIEDHMYDEVMDVLGDLLGSRDDVRAALSIVNADAVWLKECSQGRGRDLEIPRLGGYKFSSLDPFYRI